MRVRHSVNEGFGNDLYTESTGKAIQCRGRGHSVNRRTLKIEKFSALIPFPNLRSYLQSEKSRCPQKEFIETWVANAHPVGRGQVF